jgi:hypothetical protein
MRPTILATLLLATACGPQNAQIVAGDYAGFLAASNSLTVIKDNLKYEDFQTNYAIDCRDFATARNERENEQLRLEGRIPVCRGDTREDGSTVAREDWPPPHEVWLDNDGFRVIGDPLEPWRGEAIMTSEGDFQLTFHQRLPGGEDFRFAIVVDPVFRPRDCVQRGGELSFEDIDGNWIEEWSRDADNGTLYYLNASSFQFAPEEIIQGQVNPDYNPQPWFFPPEWGAGFAAGQFGDDRLRVRGARYAPPEGYIAYQTESDLFGGVGGVTVDQLFYCGSPFPDFPASAEQAAACLPFMTEQVEDITGTIMETYREIQHPMVGGDDDSLPTIRPRVHDNAWREHDGSSAGLDGWVGLHYNWIRFDDGSTLERGGSASGEFSLLFDAEDNQSRIYVRGNFETRRIKQDTWVSEFVPEVKFEENGTTVCGVPGTELQ